ncbi:unnamed protein product, partial [Urochloa humidicola]
PFPFLPYRTPLLPDDQDILHRLDSRAAAADLGALRRLRLSSGAGALSSFSVAASSVRFEGSSGRSSSYPSPAPSACSDLRRNNGSSTMTSRGVSGRRDSDSNLDIALPSTRRPSTRCKRISSSWMWWSSSPVAAAVARRHGAADLCLREVGDLLPRCFARRGRLQGLVLPPSLSPSTLQPPTRPAPIALPLQVQSLGPEVRWI